MPAHTCGHRISRESSTCTWSGYSRGFFHTGRPTSSDCSGADTDRSQRNCGVSLRDADAQTSAPHQHVGPGKRAKDALVANATQTTLESTTYSWKYPNAVEFGVAMTCASCATYSGTGGCQRRACTAGGGGAHRGRGSSSSR
jgi:hypothetical protein